MSLDDDTLSGAATPQALIGQRIDEYDVESILGSGAMGIVYRGIHHVIGKRVAIKVLKATYSDDPEMKNRVIREARTVNAIRHPSIIDAFGFGTLPTGQPYIVMDLLEGQPLETFIEEEAPMTLKEAGPVLDQLLSALAAAHQVGVIHRDIKPGNIFLERADEGALRVKLLDFGLAGLADKAHGSIKPTNPGSVVGTPAFMAPEQILAQKMTPATDLYAVGGIAYQMLTGRLPFESPNAWEMLNAKLTADAPSLRPLNAKVDTEIDRWVLSLLARDPALRPASAEDARKQLRKLLETRTSGAYASLGSRGVVPRKVWQEARTEAATVAGLAEGEDTQPPGAVKPSTESTLDEDNPFAKTHMRAGLNQTADDDEATTPPSEPPLEGAPARYEVPHSSLRGSSSNALPVIVGIIALLAVAAVVALKFL